MRRLGKLVLCCMLILAMSMTCAIAEVDSEMMNNISYYWGEPLETTKTVMSDTFGMDFTAIYGLMHCCFDDGSLFFYIPEYDNELVYMWSPDEGGEYDPMIVSAATISAYGNTSKPCIFMGMCTGKVAMGVYSPVLENLTASQEGLTYYETAEELADYVLLYRIKG